jgi:DNA mismatch endonuclease (patch repair protein)
MAFTRQRIAVLIDGCFWHSCPKHLHLPKANADYWTPRLTRNVEREAELTAVLRGLGWTVLQFWEHEPAHDTANRIITAVETERAMLAGSKITSVLMRCVNKGRDVPPVERATRPRNTSHGAP